MFGDVGFRDTQADLVLSIIFDALNDCLKMISDVFSKNFSVHDYGEVPKSHKF